MQTITSINNQFFSQIEQQLASERLDPYRQDGAPPAKTLARYAWNMALCEALYSPIQMAEIALRNAVHDHLSVKERTTTWYDSCTLQPWQAAQAAKARTSLRRERKPVVPGRVIAELNFGFWTAFFNNFHNRTGLGHYLAGHAFPHAPKGERAIKKLDVRWNTIRELRNRVFHHERILHWQDLDSKHNGIIEIIAWMFPELAELATELDRFADVRQAGLQPWIDTLRDNWPAT